MYIYAYIHTYFLLALPGKISADAHLLCLCEGNQHQLFGHRWPRKNLTNLIQNPFSTQCQALQSFLTHFSASVLVWLLLPECHTKTSSTNEKQTENSHHGKSAMDSGFHPLAFVRSFQEISWTNLWDIFLVRMCMGLAIMVYRSNFAMLLDYRYEASPKMIGYVISYSGFVGMISGFFIGRIAQFYKNDARLLMHAGILQFATLALITWAPSLMLLVICLTPLSIANSVSRVCAVNITIERGQGQQTGALLGLGASVMSISRMLSPALGGVAQQLHVSGPGLMGSFFAGAAVAVLVVVPQDGRTSQPMKDKTL